MLTKRDSLFPEDMYQQLVYSALQGIPEFIENPCAKVALQPPAMLKPWRRWTGKQVSGGSVVLPLMCASQLKSLSRSSQRSFKPLL